MKPQKQNNSKISIEQDLFNQSKRIKQDKENKTNSLLDKTRMEIENISFKTKQNQRTLYLSDQDKHRNFFKGKLQSIL